MESGLRPIRLAVNWNKHISRGMRVRWQLLQEFGCDPTPGEAAAVPARTVERIREILEVVQPSVSREAPGGESQKASLADLIPDPNAADPVRRTEFSELGEQLQAVTATLSERG